MKLEHHHCSLSPAPAAVPEFVRHYIARLMGTLLIDGLKLEAPETWLFRSMGQMILAQRDSGVGSLQISLAFDMICPHTIGRELLAQAHGLFRRE
jgi:hypothetical protein